MSTEIKVPNLSTKNALDYCRTLDSIVCTGNIILDFSETGSFHPTGMLMVSSAVRAFMRRNNLDHRQIRLEFGTNNSKNISYANHMGFFESMGFYDECPFISYSSDTCIPIKKLNITDLVKEYSSNGVWLEDGEIVEKEARKLAIVLGQKSNELVKLFTYVIREIIRNIPEHSNSKNIWICGQYWKSLDLAEIAILDEGIGIYNSLKSNVHYREIVDNNEFGALHLAVKPGVSRTFAPGEKNKDASVWANSGFGLFMVKGICTMLDGRLDLLSKTKGIRCFPDATKGVYTALPGTVIGIRLKPSKVKKADELFKTIRLLGEKQTKGTKDRYHRASKPSQGLMA